MIVFSFMQEDSRTEENYLVTKVYETKEDLFEDQLGWHDEEEDQWYDGFMAYGLVDVDKWLEPVYDEDGEPVLVSEEKMKEILTGEWDDIPFEAHGGEVYYTFSVTYA